MSRARTGRGHRSIQIKGDGPGRSNLCTADEGLLISALELALEKTIELGVLRCLLTVGHGLGSRL